MQRNIAGGFWWTALALVGCLSGCGPSTGTVSVTNKSNEVISRSTLGACGRMFEIVNLPPAETRIFTYPVNCEGEFSIQVEFKSGRSFQTHDGYITNGVDMRHDISVTDSGIEIEPRVGGNGR
jgi:hypothetical protein